MWCCALIPLGLFLFAGPMVAGGRGGLRPYLWTLAVGWGLLAVVFVAQGRDAIRILSDTATDIGLAGLLAMSAGMGGLVVWVKAAEDRPVDRTRCRRCGYDMRASPDRCPECGTPTRSGAEEV